MTDHSSFGQDRVNFLQSWRRARPGANFIQYHVMATSQGKKYGGQNGPVLFYFPTKFFLCLIPFFLLILLLFLLIFPSLLLPVNRFYLNMRF